tara:strand:- start:6554 stop:7240 length:687 start_codon:yes stop_codon:yes gene_type:complete
LKKRKYFTKVHEDAIVKYASTEDNKIRTQLYIDWIEPAFDEMVDKIVYTYKFTNLPNIDCLKEECKSWLTTILDKFNPDKGSKAFSYFSVITKNWFIHKVKKNSRAMRREVHLDDLSNSSADYEQINSYLTVDDSYERDRETAEFWYFLWKEVRSWEKLKLKENEKKVLQAVKILFDSAEDIEIFNKKAIYLYIREITGLNTKQVVNNLNKMRNRYREWKKDWHQGKI